MTKANSANASSSTSPSVQQIARRIKRNRRLHTDIKSVAQASCRHDYLGPNAPVSEIAAQLGFKSFDLAIADIRCEKVTTFIVVPFQTWCNAYLRRNAIRLRVMARSAGYRAILVPQGVLQREPQLSNARLIARSANARLDATGVMSVIGHLVEHGASTLAEVAALVTHRDPIGSIFNLLCNGDVSIDMTKPITPSTLVDLGHRQIRN